MNQLVQSLHRANGVLDNGVLDNGRDVQDQGCNGFLDRHSEAALGLANLDGLPSSELYKRVQHGADIPLLGLQRPAPEKTSSFRHQTSDVIRKSLPSDESSEDDVTRRRKLEELIEAARRQHRKLEAERNESRKHHDFFTPAQKSPISPTRYENVEVSPHHSSSSPQPRNSPALSDETLASQSLSPDRGLQVQGRARALYNFSSQSPREMSFGKGDILYLLHQVDRNWFLAERNGQVGIIPVNYILILPPGEGRNTPAVGTAGLARAKFSFCGETSAELSLIKGEFVSLLRRVDENWFEGHTGGRHGIFPSSYVSVIREVSSSSMVTTPIPGTGSPEMLSPISWKTSTPPLNPSPTTFNPSPTTFNPSPTTFNPSPTTFNPSPPATYPWGHRPPHRLPAGSQSSDELLWPEFTVFGQKGALGCPRRNEELDFSLDSCKSAELGDAGVSFDYSSSASGSVKKSWSQVSDEDCFIKRYKAVIDYTPLSEDELELKKGDEVWVLDQSDDGWFVGTSTRTGQSGVLPGHYVQKSWETTASH